MYKIAIVIFITTITGLNLSAQSRIFASGFGVVGYNHEEIKLWKYEFESSPSIGYQLGIGYQYYYKNKYFAKTGLYGKQSFAKFKINNEEGNGTSYSAEIPVSLGLRFYKDWEVSAGVSWQNYKDVSEFDINSSYNIKTNILGSASYWIDDKWRAEFKFSRSVSEISESLVAKNFTNHFFLGINYYIK